MLNQKIRIFRWIREEHLDIPHSPHNEAYLNNAQSGECCLIAQKLVDLVLDHRLQNLTRVFLFSRLRSASLELKKINSYKAPRDKVICILNCCKFIFSKSGYLF